MRYKAAMYINGEWWIDHRSPSFAFEELSDCCRVVACGGEPFECVYCGTALIPMPEGTEEQDEADKEQLEGLREYELCSLFCDYHEWLEREQSGTFRPKIQAMYERKMDAILREIARRVERIPSDPKAELQRQGAEEAESEGPSTEGPEPQRSPGR